MNTRPTTKTAPTPVNPALEKGRLFVLRPQEIAPKNISLCDVVIDSGDVDKRASVDEITVSQNSCGYTVKPGGKAELTANNTIRILPGFHAERGSRFHAQLAYCGTTAE